MAKRIGWRLIAVGALLLLALAAVAGAAGAAQGGQEAAAVTRFLAALLALVGAWLLVLTSALR